MNNTLAAIPPSSSNSSLLHRVHRSRCRTFSTAKHVHELSSFSDGTSKVRKLSIDLFRVWQARPA
jgi:hypothetical protein